MTDRPEAMNRAVEALHEALARAAGRVPEAAAPLAERLASAAGTNLGSLAAGGGRAATEAALQAASTFLTDAASTDPERRAQATASLEALRDRLQGAGLPLDDLGGRLSAWLQAAAAVRDDDPPRGVERLRDLASLMRGALDQALRPGGDEGEAKGD